MRGTVPDQNELMLLALADADEILGEDQLPEIRSLFIQGWVKGLEAGVRLSAEEVVAQAAEAARKIVDQARGT